MNKDEKKILDSAADDVVKRVLTIAKSTDPDKTTVDSTDFALLTIRYGSFLDEGFFKLLRNKIFGYALGAALLVGFTTWAIFNIVLAWTIWRTM